MTKTELKQYREDYQRRSRELRESSLQDVLQAKETPEEQEKRIERLLKPTHYNELCRYWFKEYATSDCAPGHIRIYKELYNMKVINQFVHAFRGYAKSMHAVVMSSFGLKQSGLLRFKLVVGINEDRAILLLSDLQMQLESNERILNDFGNQAVYGDWADGEFQTADGCFFKAVGLNQPFRGLRFGAHRITDAVVDDCEDKGVANNERIVKERVQKIVGDLRGAFSKDLKRLQVCNNDFVSNGLMDGLHEKLDESPFTRTHRINLSTGSADTAGKPTWPAYYDREAITLIHADNDLNTLKREYYNTHVNEGKVIKEAWLKYPKLPRGTRPDIAIGCWDLSYEKDGDYKAMALVAVYRSKMYLVDIFCSKCEISVAIEHHYARALHYHRQEWNVLWYFDATASQKAVFQPLFQQASVRFKFYNVPIPDHIPGVDKFLRMEATLVNVFFNGILLMAEKVKDHPHWKVAKAQLLSIEKGSKGHDDWPDALERAVRKAQFYLSEAGGVDYGSAPLFGRREIGGF